MCNGLCGLAILSGVFVTAIAGAVTYKLLQNRSTGSATASEDRQSANDGLDEPGSQEDQPGQVGEHPPEQTS